MSQEKVENRSGYLSLLRVLAAVSVVVLHTNGRFWHFSYESWWRSANAIDCLFYFAVPVFFMLSGATLIGYRDRYSTKEYLLRRFKKTVVPYIVWSFFALGYDVASGRLPLSQVTRGYIFQGLIEGTLGEVYWFFPALFFVYLCIPLLAAVPESMRKSVFSYSAVLLFLLNSLFPLLIRLFWPSVQWPYSIGLAGGYLLYVLIGYLLHRYDTTRRCRVLLYASAVFGLLLHLFGTEHLSYAAGDIVETFKDYGNAPCILYSVGVFVLGKQVGGKLMDSPLGKPVRFLEPCTFGVYLIHKFLQYELNKLPFISTETLGYSLGAPLIIIPVAAVMITLLRKIPYIRRIVP